jgi:hypothetical protein
LKTTTICRISSMSSHSICCQNGFLVNHLEMTPKASSSTLVTRCSYRASPTVLSTPIFWGFFSLCFPLLLICLLFQSHFHTGSLYLYFYWLVLHRGCTRYSEVELNILI